MRARQYEKCFENGLGYIVSGVNYNLSGRGMGGERMSEAIIILHEVIQIGSTKRGYFQCWCF